MGLGIHVPAVGVERVVDGCELGGDGTAVDTSADGERYTLTGALAASGEGADEGAVEGAAEGEGGPAATETAGPAAAEAEAAAVAEEAAEEEEAAAADGAPPRASTSGSSFEASRSDL